MLHFVTEPRLAGCCRILFLCIKILPLPRVRRQQISPVTAQNSRKKIVPKPVHSGHFFAPNSHFGNIFDFLSKIIQKNRAKTSFSPEKNKTFGRTPRGLVAFPIGLPSGVIEMVCITLCSKTRCQLDSGDLQGGGGAVYP